MVDHNSPASKRKKYKSQIGKTLMRHTRMRAFYNAEQHHDPGRGWTFDMKWPIFTMKVDFSKASKLSKSEKSFVYATTGGVYGLQKFGYPDYYVIAHAMRKVDLGDRMDVKLAKRLMKVDSKIGAIKAKKRKERLAREKKEQQK